MAHTDINSEDRLPQVTFAKRNSHGRNGGTTKATIMMRYAKTSATDEARNFPNVAKWDRREPLTGFSAAAYRCSSVFIGG